MLDVFDWCVGSACRSVGMPVGVWEVPVGVWEVPVGVWGVPVGV